MRFDWDAENRKHIAAHRVTSEEVEQVILNHPVDLEYQTEQGEGRVVQLGETAEGRILIVVSTLTSGGIRTITAWPAKDRLRRYWRSLQLGLPSEREE